MSQYFPPYRRSGCNTKVELDLSSYATKTYLKNVTHVDVSNFALKTNLASLKTEIDELNVKTLKPVPNDLAKLSNIVKTELVKKTEHNKLVSKVNGIDTTNFVSLGNEDQLCGKKMPDVSGLVKKKQISILGLLRYKIKHLVLVV